MNRPIEGEHYYHYKGNSYKILGVGKIIDEIKGVTDALTEMVMAKYEPTLGRAFAFKANNEWQIIIRNDIVASKLIGVEHVIYQGVESGEAWVRSLEDWNTPVEKEDSMVNRFSLVD